MSFATEELFSNKSYNSSIEEFEICQMKTRKILNNEENKNISKSFHIFDKFNNNSTMQTKSSRNINSTRESMMKIFKDKINKDLDQKFAKSFQFLLEKG